MYQDVPGCTRMYQDVPGCTRMYQALFCGPVHIAPLIRAVSPSVVPHVGAPPGTSRKAAWYVEFQ